MRHRHRSICFAIFLLLLLAGCGKPVEEIPAVPMPQTPPTQSVGQTVPEPAPSPSPELLEPLWNDAPELVHVRDIQRNEDTVSIFENKTADTLLLRYYQMGCGERVTMGRIQNSAGEISACQWETTHGGTLRWYDRAAGQWQDQPLEPGKIGHSMLELTLDDDSSFLIYLPKTYRLQENGVLEYLPDQDGVLNIAKVGETWKFSLLGTLPGPDCVSDFIMVQGDRPMLNWDHPYCSELWKNYTMETEGKWCFDGYYWPCPDDYTPSGKNYLAFCPAAYLIKSFAYAVKAHPAADALALAMLDTMSLRQNEQGFWPSTAKSNWLYADYGVDTGYYDTRFNSDLIEIYRIYWTYRGGDLLRETMERYISYYVQMADETHFTSPHGGWFIPDYSPAAVQKPHSSLNHQLAECIELYHFADILHRPDLEELANRMLFAVTDMGSRWITESGDLHYCVFPDESFGMQDYPYLTYNDLLELQNLLTERYGAPNASIQLLMNQKKLWMDANGVTEYNK